MLNYGIWDVCPTCTWWLRSYDILLAINLNILCSTLSWGKCGTSQIIPSTSGEVQEICVNNLFILKTSLCCPLYLTLKRMYDIISNLSQAPDTVPFTCTGRKCTATALKSYFCINLNYGEVKPLGSQNLNWYKYIFKFYLKGDKKAWFEVSIKIILW